MIQPRVGAQDHSVAADVTLTFEVSMSKALPYLPFLTCVRKIWGMRNGCSVMASIYFRSQWIAKDNSIWYKDFKCRSEAPFKKIWNQNTQSGEKGC